MAEPWGFPVSQVSWLELALYERVALHPPAEEVFHQGVCPDERDLQADQVVNIQQDMKDHSCEQVFERSEKSHENCNAQVKFNGVENADSEIRDGVEVLINILPEKTEHSCNVESAGSDSVEYLVIYIDQNAAAAEDGSLSRCAEHQ